MSILKQKRLFSGGRSTRHSARFESSTSKLVQILPLHQVGQKDSVSAPEEFWPRRQWWSGGEHHQPAGLRRQKPGQRDSERSRAFKERQRDAQMGAFQLHRGRVGQPRDRLYQDGLRWKRHSFRGWDHFPCFCSTHLVTFYNAQEEVKSSLREMMPEDEVVSIQKKQTLRNPLNEMKLTRSRNVLSVGKPSGRYGRQWGRGNWLWGCIIVDNCFILLN